MPPTELEQVLAEMRAFRTDLTQLRTQIDNQSSLAEQRHNELRAELDSLRTSIRTGQAEVGHVSAKVHRLLEPDFPHQRALKRRRPEFTPTPTHTPTRTATATSAPLHSHNLNNPSVSHHPQPRNVSAVTLPETTQAHTQAQVQTQAHAQIHAPSHAAPQPQPQPPTHSASPTTPATQRPTLWIHRPNDNTPLPRAHPLPPITPITPVVNALTPAYTPPRATSIPTVSTSAPAPSPVRTPTRVAPPPPASASVSMPTSMVTSPVEPQIEQQVIPPQHHTGVTPIVRQGPLPIPPPSVVSTALVQHENTTGGTVGGTVAVGSTVPRSCLDEPRKGARVFTTDERRVLEDEYEINKFPTKRHIEDLALKLAKPDEKVRTWFNNRRSLDRRLGKLVVRAHSQVQQNTTHNVDEQTPVV